VSRAARHALFRATYLSVLALSGCQCKREVTKPVADAELVVNESAPVVTDAPAAPPSAIAVVPTVPTVACTTSPGLRWSNDPMSAFSCSEMRTSPSGSYRDESGAPIRPLEFTIAPGTPLAFSVAVKGSKVRYELKGAPASAKVSAGSFQWTVAGAEGDTMLFSVAAIVTLPEGERCVQQPVVVHVHDDDATRANQVANRVRWEALSRKLKCMWAHQGPDPAENGRLDALDETNASKTIACGGTLVTVDMRDLNGDGRADAIVHMPAHVVLDAKPGEHSLSNGPGVQIYYRKGNDFVFAYEAPGDLFEAPDGSMLFVDADEQDSSSCPPRPYQSTGVAFCPHAYVEVFRVIGGKIEQTNTIYAEETPGFDPSSMGCPRKTVAVEKDAKGRITGFRKGKEIIAWDAKGPP
jgi:hypothetical protein